MKESWKAINELLHKRSRSSNINSLKESGSETVHKKDISYTMNSFFCSVSEDLADKIDPAPNPLLAGDYEVKKHKARFNFRTIEMQTAKSFRTENISSYFLKLALPFIETCLLVCSIHPLKQVVFPTRGKLIELLKFSKKEIRLRSLTIDHLLVLPVITRLFEK